VTGSSPLAGGKRTEARCSGVASPTSSCVFTDHFKVIEPPRRLRHNLFCRVWTPSISMYIYVQRISTVYPSKVWRMGLLGAWTAACWFLLALSRSHICSAAPFAQSALCPLLSRFIRCTDDYRKPHLRSPTLIASPSSSSPFASSRVSLPSLRFALRSCIRFSRRRRSSFSPFAIP